MKSKCLTQACLGLAIAAGSVSHALAVGAVTPFKTLEAEAGARGGGAALHQIVAGDAVPTVATPELEASGAAYVTLSQNGDSVSWSNPVANATGLNLRCSIPDAATGGGMDATLSLYVNGVFRQSIPVSSRQSWIYRNATPNPDNPNGGGTAYKFYNEDRAVITGAAIPSGATIRLQKDSGNTAAYYNVDCIDLEAIPVAKTQPANSLSVVTYGADPNFSADSTTAIQSCVNDARSQGKTVWVPAGKYKINSLSGTFLNFAGVTVEGAGMWQTMLYRQVQLPPPTLPWRSKIDLSTNSVVRDLSVDSNAIYKGIGDASGGDYGFASGGDHWLIERVWVQHCQPQWLSGTDGTIRDCRIGDSWADGINLNNGNIYRISNLGLRLTAQNNFIRGTGDDGIATFSDAGPQNNTVLMDGTKIINNTIVAPWWANGLRVAGGKNILVQDNLITDGAAHEDMVISTYGATGHPVQSATVQGNVMRRGSGWTTNYRMAVEIFNVSNVVFARNAIEDSRRNGLQIGNAVTNLTATNNVISHSAWTGLQVGSASTGTGTLQTNAVINLPSGQVAYSNLSTGTFPLTLSGNSWQTAAPVANGTYWAIARHSGLILDAKAAATTNGTQLQQWTGNSGANQKWVFTQLGGNAYKIVGLQSGRAVEVPSYSMADGAVLQLWDWLAGRNQIWLITPTDSGYATVVNVNSGKAMEVTGGVGATAAGAMVDQASLGGTESNKQWLMTP